MTCPAKNEGLLDRIIRGILGTISIVGSILTSGVPQIILGIVGAILIITSLTGFCLLYTLLGINTNKKE